MARKSRKTYRSALYPEEAMKQTGPVKTPTAVYCRLSKADEVTGKDSMDSQLKIIRQFISQHDDLEIAEEFLDDGFSGTNYDRPEYERMMDGVRDGRFRCLIVKDLSRLGRSYLETSDLLEMELPLYGCRFVSVNDRIDTDEEPIDTILVGLKNIINQKFAEDISKKIKVQFRQRAEHGEMLGGPVAYGYRRNPDALGYLLIDEEAAKVVRHIYELKISGKDDVAIARILDEEGIITPKQYHDLKAKGEEPTEVKHWRPDTVRSITINPVYLGHMFHGKFKEKHFIGEPDHKTRRSQWVMYENVNPPIISQDTFDQAIEVRRQLYKGEIKRWNKNSRRTSHRTSAE